MPGKDDLQADGVKRIVSPDGMNLDPEPAPVVRISKRAVVSVLVVVIGLLLAFAYGGWKRTQREQSAASDKALRKNVAPASSAGAEFTRSIPSGNVPMAANREGPQPAAPPSIRDLQAPADLYASGSGPIPGMAPANERVLVRQAPPPAKPATPPVSPTVKEPTDEERRVAAAYQRERDAMLAPTSIRTASAASWGTRSSDPAAARQVDDIARITALTKSLSGGTVNQNDVITRALQQQGSAAPENDFDTQNSQARKEAFLQTARAKQTDTYLRSTRVAPLSRFEIKAGWEIPAILEQGLNSDLPGELKALVTANVYDTATGLYLLIPQGSRLVGRYDSRVGYGQTGVQAVWDRIIFPDASAVDLAGMVGMDAQGNAGLRQKVDRHYNRLFGMAVLSSLFALGFELTQQRNRSVLTIPSPAETAGATVGREVAQVGAQMTRRNLNVQPTVKIDPGYKFTVRVNRDMLFEAPYESLPAASSTSDGNTRITTTERRNPE